MAKFIVEMPDDEALALAQMCKRICYEQIERLASPHDGGQECASMATAIIKLQNTLAEAGYAPR